MAQTQNRKSPDSKPNPHRRPAQHARPNSAPTPKRRGNAGLIVVLLLVAVAVLVAVVLFLTQCNKPSTSQSSSDAQTNTAQSGGGETSSNSASQSDSGAASDANKDSWELTLVNSTHPLPEDWKVELTTVSDGKQVDARIADQFEQMIADCKAAGYDDVFVNQAYRSHEDQQAIWDEFYNQYLAEGYSEKEAYDLTGQSVAVPGTSEHELGLAADICSIHFDETYNAPIQTWLRENGYKYGFIQRYPASKEDVTKIKNENWHFRYVGVEAATAMHESGQVLEEYLGEVNK